MNAIERGIRAATRRTSGIRDRPTVSAFTGSTPGNIRNPGETEAMKLSAVFRCQTILSQSVGKLPIYCTNEQTHERLPHNILYLLNVRPNEAMSPSVMKAMVEGNRLSSGNGYIWIIRDPRSFEPVELIPLPFELVSPQRDRNGAIWYVVTHPYTAEPMVLNAMDVIHVKGYTHNGIIGMSVLAQAAEVVAAGRAQQQYEVSYYESGGAPSGVLTVETDLSGTVPVAQTDGTTKETPVKQVIRDEWEKVHTGAKNAHRIAILDHGLKYQPIAISNADAQFVESHNVTTEDIARFYGVPLSKLYAGKQAYNSNEQNAIDYVVSTLHPILTQYDEELSFKLLTEHEAREGLKLTFNLLAELKGDTASRAAWYKAMREVGAFSADDIRDLEDMPHLENGGDIYYGNKNYVPLDMFREIAMREGGGKSESKP